MQEYKAQDVDIKFHESSRSNGSKASASLLGNAIDGDGQAENPDVLFLLKPLKVSDDRHVE
jgi:hypothetical protein